MKRIFSIRNRVSVKGLALALSVLLALSACIALPGAYAVEEGGSGEAGQEENGAADTSTNTNTGNNGNNNASAITDIQNSLVDIKDELKDAKDELDRAVAEIKSLNARIAELEAQIEETEAEIEYIQGEIVIANGILFEIQERIVYLDREIFDQNSALNKRLRLMYTTGDQSMLAVLLSSDSFIDFLTNIEMVRKIHESDVAFLIELEAMLDEVEQKKVEAQKIEEDLRLQRAILNERKAELEVDREALAVARNRVRAIRDEWQRKIDELEKESKRLERELVSLTSQWGDYAGGAMAWPVLGTVTSEFGNRIHPITGRWAMHTGIDIAARSGTPIHAAADGLVYFSGWNSGGYGNLIIVDNGSGIFTLYAHNSANLVSKGDVVHRGNVIGLVGSTGNSTGPHIHFEVRVNGVPQNPRGWLGAR
ncbi:MAG: peptidoglycan DD-metalloendopeptidase family protein [Clostridiales bacterium]|nr:peptidoglycan DD-metalloendopeptidase family protein [Clostridiales bacterium]